MGDSANYTLIEEGGEVGPRGLPRLDLLHVVIGMQVIIALVGTPANSLVLYLYGRRGERFTYSIGIMALAALDLFACCVYMPYSIIVEAVDFYMISDFFCKLFHLVGSVFYPVTLFILTILSIDRCLCVCHSHLHATYQMRVKAAVVSVILLAFGVAIIPFLACGVYSDRPVFGFNASHVKNAADGLVFVGYCHINGLIATFEDIKRYTVFFQYFVSINIVATFLIYGATFFVVLYRRHFTKNDSVPGTTRQNPDTTGSIQIRCTDSSVPEEIGNPDPGNERGVILIQEEQRKIAAMLFTVTSVGLVLSLPAVLMASQKVPFNLVLFYLNQVSLMTNPAVYFCMDVSFRKEVKDLFNTGWSNLSK